MQNQGRRQKDCEFGQGEGEKENRNFGVSLSLSRALDWKIEVPHCFAASNCCQFLHVVAAKRRIGPS